jgi:sulfhydrogenase subunit beta (sulfur reductase)
MPAQRRGKRVGDAESIVVRPRGMNAPVEDRSRRGKAWRLPKARLGELIEHLWQEGFRVLGPVPRNGGIVFDEVRQVADLPVGLREEQQPGRYRLVPGVAGEIFGVVNGPGSLKPSLFAPEEPLLQVRKQRRGFRVEEVVPDVVPLLLVLLED